jgi:hypothetical protein
MRVSEDDESAGYFCLETGEHATADDINRRVRAGHIRADGGAWWAVEHLPSVGEGKTYLPTMRGE